MDSIIEAVPRISVIMPVYNAEKYVGEAIESILNQTETDFEFLILNDGSTDRSSEVIKTYTDRRIKYFEYKENFGLVKQLNEGIKIAQGKYIARMDADDISMPDRFRLQAKYLDNNTETGLCGAWCKTIEATSRTLKFPEKNDELKVHLLTGTTFAHPVVMIRKEALVKNNIAYCQDYYPSEDYKMWVDLAPLTKFHNIPCVLLRYRISDNQITNKLCHIQLELSKKLWLFQLRFIGINPSEKETQLHINMIINNINSTNDIKSINAWLDNLKEANSRSGFYNQDMLSDFFEKQKLESIRFYVINKYYKNRNKSISMVKELLLSEYGFKYLSFSQKIKFFVKFIFKK